MGNVPPRNKVVGNIHVYNVNLIVFGFRSVKPKILSIVILSIVILSIVILSIVILVIM